MNSLMLEKNLQKNVKLEILQQTTKCSEGTFGPKSEILPNFTSDGLGLQY